MAPQFVDVSAFQPANIDWFAYKAWSSQWDGVSRVAMRSSYGTGFEDQHFQAYRAGALAAGIDVILYYHYAYPQYNTAIAEANWQAQVVGTIRPQDQIILDFEEQTPIADAAWAITWLAQQGINYGKLPGIYSYPDFIARHLQDSRLAQFPLWYANWQFTPDERPAPPSPWTSYEAVQYTDRATNIPGIAGQVDVSIYLLGGPNVYTPQSSDFSNWFRDNGDGTWTCINRNILRGALIGFYQTLSIDGQHLPIPGLPLENEQKHTDTNGYNWWTQQCERATLVCDPRNTHDSQPGFDQCYLAHVNPPQVVTVEKIPDVVVSDIKTVTAASQQLLKDANL
jgi:GH25 family lysozyme M1 (1,4-beta-N-acetylmuramidase)